MCREIKEKIIWVFHCSLRLASSVLKLTGLSFNVRQVPEGGPQVSPIALVLFEKTREKHQHTDRDTKALKGLPSEAFSFGTQGRLHFGHDFGCGFCIFFEQLDCTFSGEFADGR